MSGRRLALAAAVVLLVLAAGGAVFVVVRAGGGEAAPAAPVRCEASRLAGRVAATEGAAGTILDTLVLRNTGPRCVVGGWPGLRLLARGRPLPTRVRHGGLAILEHRPRRLVLARGDAARLLVAWNDVPVGAETRCPRSDALEVRLPGGAVRIRVPMRACGGGRLLESPLLPGD